MPRKEEGDYKPLVVVKEDPGERVPTQVLATSIREIADGMKRIRAGDLNDDGLVLLIHHAMPQNRRVAPETIRLVLDSIEGLGRKYLRKAS